MQKLYLSYDIEADGPTPSVNSMLSIGIVAFDKNKNEIFTFERNMFPLGSGHVQNENTMKFWAEFPEQWEYITSNQVIPESAMSDLSDLLGKYKKTHDFVWVASPACFDWMFLKCYYEKFGPANATEIGYSSRCLSTLMWAYCQQNNITKQTRENFTKKLADNCPHTHKSTDDARAQGLSFINLCRLMSIDL
jgi:DNA polymerase III alpha subunit (gram-positive type)